MCAQEGKKLKAALQAKGRELVEYLLEQTPCQLAKEYLEAYKARQIQALNWRADSTALVLRGCHVQDWVWGITLKRVVDRLRRGLRPWPGVSATGCCPWMAPALFAGSPVWWGSPWTRYAPKSKRAGRTCVAETAAFAGSADVAVTLVLL